MSKDEFKPLFHYIEPPQKKEVGKVIIEHQTKPDPCQELESRYIQEVEKMKKEIEELKLRSHGLEEEKNRLEQDRNRLVVEIQQRQSFENLIQSLSANLLSSISAAKSDLKKDVIELAMKTAKKILMTDYCPKQDVLSKALSKLLESGIELRGEVNLYLSPNDYQIMDLYSNRLKESLGEALVLNLIVKNDLVEGEFIIETQKLWIERRYEDLLEDIEEVLRDEGDFQNLP